MTKVISYLCPRCKKNRIISKEWEETVSTHYGSSTIVHKLMICPDPECQKRVDAEITANKERTLILTKEREARILEHKNKKPSR